MVEAYIGLGSNLKRPREQINQAHLVIAKQENITEVNFSSLYKSRPMGPQDQPDYINAVMCITTILTASDLLAVLQGIENDFGRIRNGERWGARVLDLDILLYSDQQINVSDLTVPHIGLSERAFVLYPLKEIAPNDLYIPGKGHIDQLVSECKLDGLEKIT